MRKVSSNGQVDHLKVHCHSLRWYIDFWSFKKAKCGIYRVIEDPYVFVNTFRILDCDLSP